MATSIVRHYLQHLYKQYNENNYKFMNKSSIEPMDENEINKKNCIKITNNIYTKDYILRNNKNVRSLYIVN